MNDSARRRPCAVGMGMHAWADGPRGTLGTAGCWRRLPRWHLGGQAAEPISRGKRCNGATRRVARQRSDVASKQGPTCLVVCRQVAEQILHVLRLHGTSRHAGRESPARLRVRATAPTGSGVGPQLARAMATGKSPDRTCSFSPSSTMIALLISCAARERRLATRSTIMLRHVCALDLLSKTTTRCPA